MASAEVLSGGVLLSHNLSVAVPSALKGLTSGFGMGPGVSRFAMAAVTLFNLFTPCLPRPAVRGWWGVGVLVGNCMWTRDTDSDSVCESLCVVLCTWLGQALGLLVPVGWALLLYTSGLSTPCSVGGLTHLSWWETSS